MLKSIEIINFRGIKKCVIKDLALINIFVGENNSGKSTILDATFWALKEIFEPSLRNILNERVRRQIDRPELFFNFNEDLDVKVTLKFTIDGVEEEYSFIVQKIKRKVEVNDLSGVRRTLTPYLVVIFFEYGTKPEKNTYCYSMLDSTLEESTFDGFASKELKVQIINYAKNSKFLLSHVALDDLWRDLDSILSRIKQDITIERDYINRLGDVYGITHFEFLPLPKSYEKRLPAFSDRVTRVYGAFQGAGVQRGAHILSILETSKNTGLFIEEIETYQHPKALRKLAKHMIDLATKNNVQLFITTHSYYDALRYFYYGVPEQQRDAIFRCYLIERENDGTVRAELENNIERIIRLIYP